MLLFVLILALNSCAKCNTCTIDTKKETICTNSLIDNARAKEHCVKQGGLWEEVSLEH